MTSDQLVLFLLLGVILAALIWGRVRHDLVAGVGLLTAVTLGLIPAEEAFSGFSNEAVVIVALVLVVSRALENSGVLSYIATRLLDRSRSIGAHIAITSGFAAALSSVINNVAALALLMPLDIEASRRAGRPPGQSLMPLAFATILGGVVTLIGTPPNIIASSIRMEYLGEPYRMFDFTPVGLVIAATGVLFVATVGWRLVPRREDKASALLHSSDFKAELRVPEDSPFIGRPAADLDVEAENADVLFLGLLRNGRSSQRHARTMVIQEKDIVIVEGSSDGIAAFISAAKFQTIEEPVSNEGETEDEQKSQPRIVEAVVRSDSRLIGSSAVNFELRTRYRVTLLGLERRGLVRSKQVRHRTLEAGDVLLLAGPGASDTSTLHRLGLVPVNEVSIPRYSRRASLVTVGFFAAAIAATVVGLLSFPVALAICVAAYGALGIVPAREFYQQIEWPIIVMLACLLPIGAAFESVGGTVLIAQQISALTEGYPAQVGLIGVMTITMILSAVLNNVATIVILGPVAIDLAGRLGANPDTFLMGVTLAASCAFLTPVGHKNNLLIMGPGGFRFSDYWPLGLGLTIVIWLFGVPALLLFWPL